MMEYALLLAVSTVGVDYGWQRTDDGSLEYIIQLEPALLQALAEGEPIISEVHPDVRGVRRFRIVAGTNRLPREPLAPAVGEVGRAPTSQPDVEPPSVQAPSAQLPGPVPGSQSPPGGVVGFPVDNRAFPDFPLRDRAFPANAAQQPASGGQQQGPPSEAPPLIGGDPRANGDLNRPAPPAVVAPSDTARPSGYQPWSRPAPDTQPANPGSPTTGGVPDGVRPVPDPRGGGPGIRPLADPNRSAAAPNVISPGKSEQDLPLLEPPRRFPEPSQRDANVQLAGGLQAPDSVSTPAPNTSQATTPKTTADNKPADDEPVQAEGRPWWGWTLALLALIISIVLNGYLGMLARGFYTRYRELAAEIRSAPAVDVA